MEVILVLPEEFKIYFDYIEANFFITKEEYCEKIIKAEIYSRNDDLSIF